MKGLVAPLGAPRGEGVGGSADPRPPTPERGAGARERAGKRIFAVTDNCAGCGACIKTCPEKAIRPAPQGHPSPLVVLEDRCTGCAECAEVCPVAACVEVLLLADLLEERA